ncbi:hypothetical protein D3C83_265610 [compost metagenome]
MRRDETQHAHAPGLDVDLDFRELRAKCEDGRALGVRAAAALANDHHIAKFIADFSESPFEV